MRLLHWAVVGISIAPAILEAQEARDFFAPLTDGDGQRYPLALSPAIWNVLGPITMAPGTDGLTHVPYVIRLTNKSGSPMTLQSVDTVNPHDGNTLTGTNRILTIKNEDVTGDVLPFLAPATLDATNYSRTLDAGLSGAIYMDVTYSNRNEVPDYISHRIVVSQLTDGSTQTYAAIDAPIAVDKREPIILSPPLRGARWLDGNGCCREIGPHRWALTPIYGDIEPAEMFAIDFVQLNEDSSGYKGDIHDLTSYAFYGTEVYAAAAGTVVEVVRDLPNEVPGANPAHPTAEKAAGNHVIVDVGGGRYILYAHLAPYSPAVHAGDFIQRGYVLGKLGNSGNTDGPHLHFQVMDRPSALGAHGLPFVFDHMVRSYRFANSLADEVAQYSAGLPLSLVPTANPVRFENTMPLTLDLVDFR